MDDPLGNCDCDELNNIKKIAYTHSFGKTTKLKSENCPVR